MRWTAIAACLLAAGVALGAFGAHGLRDKLDAYSLGVYEKAVFYHLVHGLGLLIVSLLPTMSLLSDKAATWICSLLLFGTVVFSGTLYLLAISGVRWLGAITPLGGLSFIVAWLLLAYQLYTEGK